LAAHHVAWRILGTPMDRGVFHGPDDCFQSPQIQLYAELP